MADPRVIPLADRAMRKDNLSDLMRAKSRTTNGEKVNACPFGCTFTQLDENGYCHHLIGFTNDGVNYEPMKKVAGRRVVQVATKEVGEEIDPEDGTAVKILQPVLEKIQAWDKLVQITVSSRVYREKKLVPKTKSA